MSDATTDLPIEVEDLHRINDLDDWKRIPGTLEVEPATGWNKSQGFGPEESNVYQHESGRFFRVAKRAHAGTGGDSITEVYPHPSVVYRVNPRVATDTESTAFWRDENPPPGDINEVLAWEGPENGWTTAHRGGDNRDGSTGPGDPGDPDWWVWSFGITAKFQWWREAIPAPVETRTIASTDDEVKS